MKCNPGDVGDRKKLCISPAAQPEIHRNDVARAWCGCRHGAPRDLPYCGATSVRVGLYQAAIITWGVGGFHPMRRSPNSERRIKKRRRKDWITLCQLHDMGQE